MKLHDRADGVKGHYCIGRPMASFPSFTEFWHEKYGWCAAGTLFKDRESAIKKMEELWDTAEDITPDKCKYAIEMSTDARKLVKELGDLALQDHLECEDTWYACPKSSTGCCDERQGPECNCGADSHNERVNEILRKLL